MFDSICPLHLRGQAGKLWHMLMICLLLLWGQACRL